jgi:RNA polymerase sigma-70 factor (ECF subfamily)
LSEPRWDQRDLNRDAAWQDACAEPLAERLVDSETGPTTALSRNERRAIVRSALERIDAIDREILALRYFDGLNFAQIGAILSISQNAATKRGLRALVELRDLIPAAYRPPGASQP